jgi:hypothetical protein
LLRGETIIPAQNPKHAVLREIDVATLELPKGQPVYVTKEEYVMGDREKQSPVAPKVDVFKDEAIKEVGAKRWARLQS